MHQRARMTTNRIAGVALCLAAVMPLVFACGGAIDSADAERASESAEPSPALPVRGPGNDAPPPPPATPTDPTAPTNVDPPDPFTTDVTRRSNDAGIDASDLPL
jgi:hypothetical protein